MLKKLGALALCTCVLLPATVAAETVNVYSSRGEALIKPILDKFSAASGVDVNLITAKSKALMQRMRAEGRNSPADLLLTTDAGNLVAAQQAGLFQSVSSELLDSRIPAHLRDPDQNWYGLSQRARVLIYNPNTVDVSKLTSYEDLVAPEWHGRICVRSSNNIYNQSLLASMIAHNDSASAEAWAKGVRDNMARKPQGNDRGQISAVAAGECDVAIVNSYYLGIMLNGDDADQQAAAKAVTLLYPNQNKHGTHVNISGAGVSKHAPNRDNAIALLEFLASDESQQWYAETNNEYPAVKGVSLSQTVASWGEFKADGLAVVKLGELNAEAVRAFDRAGWE